MAASNNIAWTRILAEAVAIVASILVAFWIDAWWAERQETALGKEYEDRILAELRSNRALLDAQLIHVERNLAAAKDAAAFFGVDRQTADGEQLIVDLYNMGRDMPDRFDVSTYDDLVATGRVGLIRDLRRREAIQKAYSELHELGSILRPNRAEYLTGLRGWIPQPVIEKIREACPSMRVADPCSDADIDIDARLADAIVERFSSDTALLAYRLREQGLFEKHGRAQQAKEAVTEAISLLE